MTITFWMDQIIKSFHVGVYKSPSWDDDIWKRWKHITHMTRYVNGSRKPRQSPLNHEVFEESNIMVSTSKGNTSEINSESRQITGVRAWTSDSYIRFLDFPACLVFGSNQFTFLAFRLGISTSDEISNELSWRQATGKGSMWSSRSEHSRTSQWQDKWP